MIRLELLTPQGDFLQSTTYNKVFTQHGIIMIFFFLIPSIPATLGNFLIPMMIGAKDLAFPRINLLSWYIYLLGGVVTIYALLAGGVDTGWTFYTPFSTTFSNSYVVATGLGIFINGFSSILTGLNFIVTIHTMRAPGMTWFRMPLFLWSHYATSLIMILGTPVIAITILLLAFERLAQVGIFNPALGGDPVLFQHLFWFYSHPAVYIMILPVDGRDQRVDRKLFAQEHLRLQLRRVLQSRDCRVWLSGLGSPPVCHQPVRLCRNDLLVPEFRGGDPVGNQGVQLDRDALQIVDLVRHADALCARVYRAVHDRRHDRTCSWLRSRVDVHLSDTYFVVAHFHYIMVGGALMGYLGGLHYWWPKITGRMYPEGWGRFSALVIFVGFNLTFLPQFVAGYLGMPRRYHAYPPEFQVFNVLSTAGASILGFGMLIPAIYFVWSMRYGRHAEANPWHLPGLEWRTQSPPPTENFEVTPVVTWDAYEFAPREETEVVGKFRPELERI